MSHCSFKSFRLFKWRQAVTESFGVIVCTTVNVDKRKRKKIISEKGLDVPVPITANDSIT